MRSLLVAISMAAGLMTVAPSAAIAETSDPRSTPADGAVVLEPERGIERWAFDGMVELVDGRPDSGVALDAHLVAMKSGIDSVDVFHRQLDGSWRRHRFTVDAGIWWHNVVVDGDRVAIAERGRRRIRIYDFAADGSVTESILTMDRWHPTFGLEMALSGDMLVLGDGPLWIFEHRDGAWRQTWLDNSVGAPWRVGAVAVDGERIVALEPVDRPAVKMGWLVQRDVGGRWTSTELPQAPADPHSTGLNWREVDIDGDRVAMTHPIAGALSIFDLDGSEIVGRYVVHVPGDAGIHGVAVGNGRVLASRDSFPERIVVIDEPSPGGWRFDELILDAAPHGFTEPAFFGSQIVTSSTWAGADGLDLAVFSPVSGACQGRRPTATGAGLIVGTPGDDVLLGSDGPDRIIGRGGDDIICGGGGSDEIDGGSGDDQIDGGAEWDRIVGGSGVDLIDYRRSPSGVEVRLQGGVAVTDDVDGVESVLGSMLDDVIVGSAAANTLRGLDGDDTLVGLAGPDRLFGHDGDDQIVGGPGQNEIDGGPAADTCDVSEGAGWALDCEFIGRESRWAEQVVALDGVQAGTRFGEVIAVDAGRVVVGASTWNQRSGEAFVLMPDGAGGWTQQTLTPPDGTYSPRFGSSVAIEGDLLAVGAPDLAEVHLFRHDGNDVWRRAEVLASSFWVTERHGFGSSVAIDGDRVVVAAPLHAVAAVRSGSLFVFDLDGRGGWSETRLITDDREDNDRLGELLEADAGLIASTVSMGRSQAAGILIWHRDDQRGWISTRVGDLAAVDDLDLDDGRLAALGIGRPGPVLMTAEQGADGTWLTTSEVTTGRNVAVSDETTVVGPRWSPGGLRAKVFREVGDDGRRVSIARLTDEIGYGDVRALDLDDGLLAIIGWDGQVRLYADPLIAQDCQGRPATAAGSGVVVGTPGDDVIVGSDGADVLLGLGGDDLICGGHGVDLLVGGTGDDVLDGGTAVDTVRYDDSATGVTVTIGDGPGDGPAGESDDVQGTVEVIVGSWHDDVIVGIDGDETLIGLGGDDRLIGRGGVDRLLGGPGRDILDGGPGDDVVDGGAHIDVCTTSSGADQVTWCEIASP